MTVKNQILKYLNRRFTKADARGINPENGSRGIKAKQLEGNLAELEALHKTVKVKKPKTIKELNTIIQSDIRSINKVKNTNSGDTKKSLIPKEYSLSQNYPNPFNYSTIIGFTIPKESEVTLRIYDITGKLVMRVIEGFRLGRGEYRYRIESFDMSGLSSGVYFYNMSARNKYGTIFSETKKMIYNK
jgi:hypothetical protein